jgi:hypothetical protein
MVDNEAQGKETKKKREPIKPTQLIAGALASVTVAYLGSRLGIAGTISGAGIASAITALASNVYQRSLDRTSSSVKAKFTAAKTARQPYAAQTQLLTRPAGPHPSTPLRPGGSGPAHRGPAVPPTGPVRPGAPRPAPVSRAVSGPPGLTRPIGPEPGTHLRTGLHPVHPSARPTTDTTAAAADAAAAEAPTRRLAPASDGPTRYLGPASPTTPSAPLSAQAGHLTGPPAAAGSRWDWRRLNLKVVIAVTIGLFVLTLGLITGIEALTGAPLSGGTQGTTFGHVFLREPTGGATPAHHPAPSTAPTGTEAPSSTEAPSTTVPPASTGVQAPPPASGTGGPSSTTAPPSTEVSPTTAPAVTVTR